MSIKKHILPLLLLAAALTGSAFLNRYIHSRAAETVQAVVTLTEDASWQTQRVDAPRFFTHIGVPSLAFLSPDIPCVVYGDDHLYLACKIDGQWQIETVDPALGVGSQAALAVGADGIMHIAYYDRVNDCLKYARGSAENWEIVSVDEPLADAEPRSGFSGMISIALDANGRPLISYADAARSMLKFAFYDGAMWWIEAVDETPGAGQFHSIQADRDGYPHIAYYDPGQQDLKMADWGEDGWTFSTVDGQGNIGQYPSLALDSHDRPHIAYYDADGQSLKYAYAATIVAAFEIETVASGGRGMFASLVLDSQDRPSIAYFYEPDWDLEFISRVRGEWVPEIVDTADRTGILATLALDPAGTPCISYYASSETLLKLACRAEDAWTSEKVDMTTNTGLLTSLEYDPAGNPVIAYQNDSQDALNIARWDGEVWRYETVEAAIDTGIHPSLALDSRAEPHVSFWQNLTLKYAVRRNGQWQVEVVDDDRDVGYHSSLALDEADDPHISYYDYTRQDLKYAFWDGQQWTLTALESSGDVGEFSSLALDAYDRPVISFYDRTNGDLKLIRCAAGEMQSQRVDHVGETELYSSLQLDAFGSPHIAYAGENQSLKYAYWDGTTWQVETLSEEPFGVGITLRLDAAGRPWISAFDMNRQNLVLWQCMESGWQMQVVDEPGDVGRFSSFAFDAAGLPGISYYDGTSGDLKFTELKP